MSRVYLRQGGLADAAQPVYQHHLPVVEQPVMQVAQFRLAPNNLVAPGLGNTCGEFFGDNAFFRLIVVMGFIAGFHGTSIRNITLNNIFLRIHSISRLHFLLATGRHRQNWRGL